MRILDLLRMSSANLWKRKVRTLLTILGVVIGTASIVVMVSLGLGLNKATMEDIEQYGGLTTIEVREGRGDSSSYTTYSIGGGGSVTFSSDSGSSSSKDKVMRLDDAAVSLLESLDHVENVYPVLQLNIVAKYGQYVDDYMTIQGMPPEGYDRGALYTKEDINNALAAETAEERKRIVPSEDRSGHGTAVAGIMAGNGSSSGGVNRGAAPGSELLVVKMGMTNEGGFPRTTELMLGLDFVIREAIHAGKPVAVNVSFGNSYGAHDGSSLLESYIDTVSQIWKNNIIIAAGNNAVSAGHFRAVMISEKTLDADISVSEYERSLNVQIWKYYGDEADIEIISPSGESSGQIKKILGPQRFRLENTEILLYYGEPAPYSINQEIYIDFIPQRQYLTGGIWTIRLLPGRIIRGDIQMWLPTAGVLNQNTGFLRPDPDLTITVPGTAKKAITVGAYNIWLDDYADFSGRGYMGAFASVKPELSAPGVDITTTLAGGGYTVVSGTSFAVPFVTGAAALLMEYGIVRKNDPYLYGDKLKAYLLAGARPLRGVSIYPDIRVGFGALCLENSFPD